MTISNNSRRGFLKKMATGSAAATTGIGLNACSSDDDDDSSTNTTSPDTTPLPAATFEHGVASGDPLQDRVIIWSRVTPETADDSSSFTVTWELAADEAFSEIVTSGEASTDLSSDYTVKVDVANLTPATVYFYRFQYNGQTSTTGRTRTLPQENPQSVKMAVFSCSNFPAGFFHAYAEAAKLADVDVAVHLGDYIYEYEADGYASEQAQELGRVSEPATELLTLDDYRTRYAQYRGDADLQAIHAQMPFICVWDDHEFMNDTFKDGAENHDPETEGDFLTRQANALKAYYEWLPIRPQDETQLLKISRSFDFGTLLSLHMLDTRVIGRDQQLDYANYIDATTGAFNAETFQADLTDANRQLLGTEQTDWLKNQMGASQATWQILGQQVLIGRMNIPAPVATQAISFSDYSALLVKQATAPDTLTETEQAILAQPSIPYNLDAWDGYFANREVVLGTAVQLDKNLIVLSGDTHNAWANDLQTIEGVAAGVEFATGSVSSPGLEDYLDEDPDTLAGGLVQLIEPLKYTNTEHRGFMVVTVTADEAQAEWIYVDTVKSTEYAILTERGKVMRTLPGAENRVVLDV